MKKFLLPLFVMVGLSVSCTSRPDNPQSEFPPDRNFGFCLTQGLKHLNEKNFEKAIPHLSAAVDIKPTSQMAQNLLGVCYVMIENLKLAKKQFEKVLALNGNHAAALSNLGSVLLRENDWNNSEKMFRKAIAIIPDDAAALFNLGNLLLMQEKIEEGYPCLSRAVELDPELLEKDQVLTLRLSTNLFQDAEICFLYARLYASQGDLARTLDYLEKAEKAGFIKWERIAQENDFEKFIDFPEIKKFLEKSQR